MGVPSLQRHIAPDNVGWGITGSVVTFASLRDRPCFAARTAERDAMRAPRAFFHPLPFLNLESRSCFVCCVEDALRLNVRMCHDSPNRDSENPELSKV